MEDRFLDLPIGLGELLGEEPDTEAELFAALGERLAEEFRLSPLLSQAASSDDNTLGKDLVDLVQHLLREEATGLLSTDRQLFTATAQGVALDLILTAFGVLRNTAELRQLAERILGGVPEDVALGDYGENGPQLWAAATDRYRARRYAWKDMSATPAGLRRMLSTEGFPHARVHESAAVDPLVTHDAEHPHYPAEELASVDVAIPGAIPADEIPAGHPTPPPLFQHGAAAVEPPEAAFVERLRRRGTPAGVYLHGPFYTRPYAASVHNEARASRADDSAVARPFTLGRSRLSGVDYLADGPLQPGDLENYVPPFTYPKADLYPAPDLYPAG